MATMVYCKVSGHMEQATIVGALEFCPACKGTLTRGGKHIDTPARVRATAGGGVDVSPVRTAAETRAAGNGWTKRVPPVKRERAAHMPAIRSATAPVGKSNDREFPWSPRQIAMVDDLRDLLTQDNGCKAQHGGNADRALDAWLAGRPNSYEWTLAALKTMRARLAAQNEAPVVVAPVTAEISPTAVVASVTDGYYALATGVDDWTFYRVNTGAPGSKWAGFQFVSREVSEEEYPVMRAARTEVLARIATDAKQATLDYGLQSKRCGRCHRKLTVKASRDRGIGPKCAGDMGY